VLLVLAAVLLPSVAEGPLLEDLRREGLEEAGNSRLAGVAVVAGVALVALGAIVPVAGRARRERYWHRLARTAGVSWLVVSLALTPVVWQAQSAHAAYQDALAQPVEEIFTTLGGAEAEALVAEVRAWQP
jgi:hypothetical protein